VEAAIKGLATVSQAIGPCDTYAAALTNFDNAISRIAVTGKTETDIRTLVADDSAVIKNLEAVKTVTVAQIRKDELNSIALEDGNKRRRRSPERPRPAAELSLAGRTRSVW